MADVYDVDYSREDIGEMLTILRVQKFKLNIEAMANKLGVTPMNLELSEDGKSAHLFTIFNKCIDMGLFKDVKLTVTIAS